MIIVSDWPHPQAARVHRRVALPGTGTRPCSAAKRPRARPGQAAPRCPDGPPADAGVAAACGRSRPAPDCHGCSGRGRRTRRAASQSRWPRPGDDPPGTASAAASQTLRPGRPLGPGLCCQPAGTRHCTTTRVNHPGRDRHSDLAAAASSSEGLGR